MDAVALMEAHPLLAVIGLKAYVYTNFPGDRQWDLEGERGHFKARAETSRAGQRGHASAQADMSPPRKCQAACFSAPSPALTSMTLSLLCRIA